MRLNPHLHTFRNGLRLLTIPQSQSPSVMMGVFVGVGTNYETKSQNGISHFLEHMCFKGTSNRPTPLDITTALESLGASYNAFTTRDMTGYWAKVATPHFEKAFDIVADMYTDPVFPEKELEQEKGVIIEEMNMYKDLPRAKVHDELVRLMYGDQPAGWHVLGTKQAVKKTTKDDFVKYRDKFYTAPNTLIVIAGAVSAPKVKKLVWQHFADMEANKTPRAPSIKESQTKPRLSVITKKLDQTHFRIGIKAFPFASKNVPALVLLSDIVGGGMSSRLFQRIRGQMGAAYYVGSSPNLYESHGMLDIGAGVTNSRLIESIGVMMEELTDLQQNGPTAAELIRSKQYTIGSLLLSLETSDDLGTFFAQEMLRCGKPTTPRQIIRDLKVVNSNDIKRLARMLFVNKRLNCAIIGPHRVTAALKEVCSF